MFRTFKRHFFPNPLDRMLRLCERKKGKKVLIAWNRGLGDIPLGIYAIAKRVRKVVPDAYIAVITRKNLVQGFSLLKEIDHIETMDWERGKPYEIPPEKKAQYDLVIEKPDPSEWVRWQLGNLTPKLIWEGDASAQDFALEGRYIGVQIAIETGYGLKRDWPIKRWEELFFLLEQLGERVLLFGVEKTPHLSSPCITDLRGKTSLFQMLSIIKHHVHSLVLPDSGISSMVYYWKSAFPLRHITLWADPKQGILKQNVSSPNPLLQHIPLISPKKDLFFVSAQTVLKELFPVSAVGVVILAAGQGTRLGAKAAKGLFPVLGKTLFEWILEKIPKTVPIAIMLSSENETQIREFFQRKKDFGHRLFFFIQEEELFSDGVGERLVPNGNGSVFYSLKKSKILEEWEKTGIEYLSVVNIDNPLADPLHAGLIEMAKKNDADVVIGAIEREEGLLMGAIDDEKQMLRVIEYSEVEKGKSYRYAYMGQMVFALPFFKKMAGKKLKTHAVKKIVNGTSIKRRETFLFDALEWALKGKLFCMPRENCYAPIKERGDVKTVEQILHKKRQIL